MSDFIILTDGGCDLEEGRLEQIGVRMLPMSITIDNEPPCPSNAITPEQLYADLHAGKHYKTAAISIGEFCDAFEEGLSSGKDVMYIGFSSALSSTFHNAQLARSDMEAKYPDRRIVLVDTKGAAAGTGYVCILASRLRMEGKPIEEVASHLEQIIPHIAHHFTVNDLFFLKRGGRISAATAVIGTVLQFKPMLHINADGKLVSRDKVRGRKASLAALCDVMGKTIMREECPFVYICQGGCPEDAAVLHDMVKERFGYTDDEIFTTSVGPTIGSHAGPGVLALIFVATER